MSKLTKIFVVLGFLMFAVLLTTGLQAQTTTNTATSNQTTSSSLNGPTSCSAGMELCKSTTGTSWCSLMPCSENTCNAKAGYEWCKPDPAMTGSQGWCNSMKGSCPVYDSAACTSVGRKWCNPNPNMASGISMKGTTGGTVFETASKGWCTSSASEKCPIYTEADCNTQGGKWCKNAPMSSGPTGYSSQGWCAQNMGANYECPIYEEKPCLEKGRTWCKDTWSGWCMSVSTDWCSGTKIDSSTTTQSKPSSPTPIPPSPINGQGQQGQPSMPPPGGPTTMPQSGQGQQWQPTTTPMPPTPTSSDIYSYSWPSTKADCDYYKGNWCDSSDTAGYKMSTFQNGYCSMGNHKCEPKNKDECSSRGRYWCEFTDISGWITTAAQSGFCSYDPCQKSPGADLVLCPDGVSSAKTYNDCPHTDILPVTNINLWPSDKNSCLNFKGNWCDGTNSAYCQSGTKKCEPKNQKECQGVNRYWCENTEASGYKETGTTSGWCSWEQCTKIAEPGMIICPDGTTSKKTLKECPNTGGVKPPDYQKCPLGMLKMDGTCPEPKPDMKLCPNGKWYNTGEVCPGDEKICSFGQIKDTATMICKPLSEPIKGKEDLSDREQKTIVAEVRYMNSDLDKLEPTFKEAKDSESLQKISDIRNTLANLPKDYSAFEVLKGLNGKIKDLRILRQSILNRKKSESQLKKDEQVKQRNLTKMKSDLEKYNKRVSDILASIETAENSGVYVEAGLRGKLASIQSLLESVKSATNYEDVRKLMLELNSLDVAGVFDEYSLLISILPDMPFIVRNVDTKLTDTRNLLDQTRDLLDAGEFDSENLLSDGEQKLEGVQTAFEDMKNFILSDDVNNRADFRDWVQSHLNAPLLGLSADLRELQELSRVNVFLNGIKSDLSKYQKNIIKLKKADRKRSQDAYNALKREYAALDKQKRTIGKDNFSDLLPQIEKVKNARLTLLDLLKQVTPESKLRQDLDSVLKKIDEKQKIESLPSLDTLIQQTLTAE